MQVTALWTSTLPLHISTLSLCPSVSVGLQRDLWVSIPHRQAFLLIGDISNGFNILEHAGALQGQAWSQNPIQEILNHEIPQILFTPQYVAHMAT